MTRDLIKATLRGGHALPRACVLDTPPSHEGQRTMLMPEETFQLRLLLRKHPVVALVKDHKVVLG
jgi:hypothetical protein